MRDIRKLLAANIEQVDIKYEGVANSQVNFANRATVSRALQALCNVPSLGKDVRSALGHRAFTNDSSLCPNADPLLSQVVQRIQTNGSALLKFLETVLPPEPDGYFTVRLPESNVLPSALKARFDSISLAFEQPVLRVYGVPIQVTLLEPGSILTELGIYLPAAGTIAAGAVTVNQVLGLVGKMLDLGIQKAKLQQENAIAKQRLSEKRQAIAKVVQEDAKARQEDAKARQEDAKARQEDAKARQEDVKLKQAELAVQQAEKAVLATELKLQGHDLDIEGTVHSLVAPSTDPHDAFPIVRNAIDQVAELYVGQTSFELQLGAPDDVVSGFPIEARSRVPGMPVLATAPPMGLLSS